MPQIYPAVPVPLHLRGIMIHEYKCFACMKQFASDTLFRRPQDGGYCPRCHTMITDTNLIRNERPLFPRFIIDSDPLAQLVINWSDVQLKDVPDLNFRDKFKRKLLEAAHHKNAQAMARALRNTRGVGNEDHGHPVLLFRFYDGQATGLLPPSKHSYDKLSAPSQMSKLQPKSPFGKLGGSGLGNASAHQAGLKKGSNFVSLSGHLPGLIRSSCNNVKGIVYGMTEEQRMLKIKLGPKFNVENRQAPQLGLFFVPAHLWILDRSSANERVHLSMEENEILFDATNASLADHLLFSLPNPF
ncbi:MAG: hypothetical protein K2Q10_03810 [Rhodospirillales bacterium]|nr:hypothetical protein [Rhodospirillales bacterium]